MTLCNLAAWGDNQIKIVEQGGLQPLIDVCGQDDPDCQRYAGMTLCN